MTPRGRPNGELRRLLAAADVVRNGTRREGTEMRPLGRKAARTRTALLEAAHQRFIETGYRSTSVQDIHEAAGVSIGTFYQYFRDKSDLMLTLVAEAIFDEAHRIFPPFDADRPDEAVRSVVEAFVHNYAATADFQRVWEEATYFDERVARFRWDASLVIENSLRDAIRAGQGAGRLDDRLDAAATARALTAMVDRYCYRSFVVEGRRDAGTVEDAVEALTELWAKILARRGRAGRR